MSTPPYRIAVSAPQPLSQVIRQLAQVWPEKRSGGSFTMVDPFHRANDELSALVMWMLTISSQIDFEWGRILTALVGGDHATVMSMWIALAGENARRDVVRAAATRQMSADDLTVFRSVETAVAPVRKRRNLYVHHLCCITHSHPDMLTFVEPDVPLMDEAEWRSKGRPELWEETGPDVWGTYIVQDSHRDSALCFRKDDIKKDISAAQEAFRLVYHLRLLASSRGEASPARQWLRETLSL